MLNWTDESQVYSWRDASNIADLRASFSGSFSASFSSSISGSTSGSFSNSKSGSPSGSCSSSISVSSSFSSSFLGSFSTSSSVSWSSSQGHSVSQRIFWKKICISLYAPINSMCQSDVSSVRIIINNHATYCTANIASGHWHKMWHSLFTDRKKWNYKKNK